MPSIAETSVSHSSGQNPKTALQAIRAKCLDCSGGAAQAVKDCPIRACALWPFRLGTNPNRKGIGRITNIKKGGAHVAE